MRVTIDGSPNHRMPHVSLVPSLIRDLIEETNHRLAGDDALDAAAYALWRLNWIHPFAGGNGRTARAFSYLAVCIGLEATPPGVPSMPTIVADRHVQYMRGLRAADAAFEKDHRTVDVTEMYRLVLGAAIEQLTAAITHSSGRPRRSR